MKMTPNQFIAQFLQFEGQLYLNLF